MNTFLCLFFYYLSCFLAPVDTVSFWLLCGKWSEPRSPSSSFLIGKSETWENLNQVFILSCCTTWTFGNLTTCRWKRQMVSALQQRGILITPYIFFLSFTFERTWPQGKRVTRNEKIGHFPANTSSSIS